MIDIIDNVPFGQDNALSSREIWRAVDCWAEETVSNNLKRLADDGAIARCRQPTMGTAFRWLYYREAA